MHKEVLLRDEMAKRCLTVRGFREGRVVLMLLDEMCGALL
jgi:hypothetical protein